MQNGMTGLYGGASIALPYNPITKYPPLVNEAGDGGTVPLMPPSLAGSFAPIAGNALVKSLSGCGSQRRPCNGLGDVTIPLVGATLPGSTWMYAAGIGLVAGIWFMSKGKG